MEWYVGVWRKYAEFDGRARRTEYWMFVLFNLLAILALGIVGGIGVAISQNSEGMRDVAGIFFIPLGLYILAAIIPALAVAVRRFHDSGKSGWLLLLFMGLGIIPIVGLVTAIIQLVFLCTDSDPGMNQYGPNPKYPDQVPGMAYAGGPNAMLGLSGQPLPPAPTIGSAFCARCGASVLGPSSFCGQCGAPV